MLEEPQHRFITDSLAYVPGVARRFLGRGLPIDELTAAGNLGLVQAALRFDPGRNVKFLTYADWWIRKRIRDAVAEYAAPVRLPRHQLERLRILQDSRKRLRLAAGFEPDRQQLAEATGLSRSVVEQLLQLLPGAQPLEQPAARGQSRTLEETLPDGRVECPQGRAVRRDLLQDLKRGLAALTVGEQEVLSLRFGFADEQPRSLREAGRELGISRESVRKIESRALGKLRRRMERGARGPSTVRPGMHRTGYAFA